MTTGVGSRQPGSVVSSIECPGSRMVIAVLPWRSFDSCHEGETSPPAQCASSMSPPAVWAGERVEAPATRRIASRSSDGSPISVARAAGHRQKNASLRHGALPPTRPCPRGFQGRPCPSASAVSARRQSASLPPRRSRSRWSVLVRRWGGALWLRGGRESRAQRVLPRPGGPTSQFPLRLAAARSKAPRVVRLALAPSVRWPQRAQGLVRDAGAENYSDKPRRDRSALPFSRRHYRPPAPPATVSAVAPQSARRGRRRGLDRARVFTVSPITLPSSGPSAAVTASQC